MPGPIPVYLEIGEKRVFASALEWPGWTRAGKDEKAALGALAAYAPRYAAVPRAARIQFGADADPTEADRICALLGASWKVFDAAVAKAPAELRKGPRGGGRDRDKIADHIIDAESAYTPKLGLKLKPPGRTDAPGVRAWRKTIIDAIRGSAGGPQTGEKRWPPRYVTRRMAWHLLDHAWEIEDRSG